MPSQLCTRYITAKNNLNSEVNSSIDSISVGKFYKLYMKDSSTFFIIKVVSKTPITSGNVTYDFSITGPCLTVTIDDNKVSNVVFNNSNTISNILSNVTSAPYDSYTVKETDINEVSLILDAAVQMITNAK